MTTLARELCHHPVLWALLAVFTARASWMAFAGELYWLTAALVWGMMTCCLVMAGALVEWWQGRRLPAATSTRP